MIARLALALATVALPTAALAQHEHGHAMPMPAPQTGAEPAAPAAAPVGDPHAGHGMTESAVTSETAGKAPPPTPPKDHAAERIYGPAEMDAARRLLAKEHGGMRFHMLMADIVEWQMRKGQDGYRWDGEGWYGGDTNRLVLKSEGAGSIGRSADEAEVQALYSRAIYPYWNLQAGVRQDIGGGARRSWATAAIEGLAPYWFEVEGSLFLSDQGELDGRITAYYDQRITQSLILQPRIELNLAAQDSRALREGSGLTTTDLDLRLRYEIRREFAPYIGVSYSRMSGETARYAQAAGERARSTALVLGVRAWF
jgi:copper resistance protein B